MYILQRHNPHTVTNNPETRKHVTLYHAPLLSPQSQVLRTLPHLRLSPAHKSQPHRISITFSFVNHPRNQLLYTTLLLSLSLSLLSLSVGQPVSLSLSLSLSFSLIITTHIFLKNLYFQFFSSQWLLVRTCCFVGGPGHPVEYSDQGGPIRSERGGGMGRTLS